MSDIVQRLRVYAGGTYPITKEAADEIERLRDKNRELNRRCQDAEAAIPSYQKLLAVPPNGDGLRFVSGNLGRALLSCLAQKQDVEIAALRDKLRQIAGEIERLRELLMCAYGCCCGDCARKIEAVLPERCAAHRGETQT